MASADQKAVIARNLSMSLRLGGFTPSTRRGVGLLGPCFKTGGAWRCSGQSAGSRLADAGHTAAAGRAGRRRSPPQEHAGTVPRQRFHILCTLSPEFFSTFPHGTCPLSDSRTCVALEGIHLPLWVAISSNPTLGRRDGPGRARRGRGFHPL